jgi:putative ABC transport system permease protein
MFQDQKVALFLGIRSLKRSSKGGVLLVIIIIALVFTNMLFLSSLIQGAVQLFNENTIVYSTSDILIEPRGDNRYIENVSSVLTRVNNAPGVRRASARYTLGATLFNKDKSLSLPVTAFRPQDEREVTRIHTRMREGEYLSEGDMNAIIIGNLVAGNVDESQDLFDSLGGVKVGDTVEIIFANGIRKEYRIKGIFQTQYYQVDYTAYLTWEEMNHVLGQVNDQASNIAVNVEQGRDLDAMVTSLMRFGVQEDVKTWKAAMGQAVEQAVESYDIINSITLIVSLVIAVVVIFIVNTIKALNNRRQIGILRAIGIERSIIVQSYFFQVMFIALLGTILGLFIMQGLIIYFQAYPVEFPEGNVSLFVEPLDMAVNAVYLFITACIAGTIPAWRITREGILNAMRR